MTDKQFRMLQLLDEQILSCTKCALHCNGHAKPFWCEDSRYVIVGEAPGKDEITKNTPFVGQAGKILWETMASYALYRKDFLIINSVNCRPVFGNKNGKPNDVQMDLCKPWIRKYLYVMESSKILLLGKYAVHTMFGDIRSIVSKNGEIVSSNNSTVMVISVHPAYCIYNENHGRKLLNESIKKFSEI